MLSHRPLALIFIALLLQACSQGAPPPAAGTSPEQAAAEPAAETTSYYEWRTRGKRGSAQREQPAFYVPTEWDAVGSLEALVRAAAGIPNADVLRIATLDSARAVGVRSFLESTL